MSDLLRTVFIGTIIYSERLIEECPSLIEQID